MYCNDELAYLRSRIHRLVSSGFVGPDVGVGVDRRHVVRVLKREEVMREEVEMD